MMKIWIDNEFRCYTEYHEYCEEVDTIRFDGMCKRYIEGYRFIPKGSEWTRRDGCVFKGEMITPIVPHNTLIPYQEQYKEDSEIIKIITGEVSINDES